MAQAGGHVIWRVRPDVLPNDRDDRVCRQGVLRPTCSMGCSSCLPGPLTPVCVDAGGRFALHPCGALSINGSRILKFLSSSKPNQRSLSRPVKGASRVVSAGLMTPRGSRGVQKISVIDR